MFYMLLNIASTVDAVSASRAAMFAAITLYLVIFALWLTGWMDRAQGAAGGALVPGGAVIALLHHRGHPGPRSPAATCS